MAVVVVGVVARFATSSPLWLDEALSVNIARLPTADLLDALRHDGAPPLYYVLLHGWVRLVGQGDLAVRALSGLMAVAALPLVWLAGRRLGGLPVAWAAVVLLASSPFAIRYGTEARMYSLVVVLVLAGFVALARVVEGPSRRASVALGLATGLLLLTHYWAFYLVAVVALGLVVRWLRARQAGARRALAAMAAGSLLFLPWLPSFLYQSANTGTPWARQAPPRVVLDTVLGFAAGLPDAALPLGLMTFGLCALGLFGRAVDGRRIELDLRGREPGRGLAAVTVATLGVAFGVGRLTGSAFAVRYAAVVFPFVVLLAALGSAALSRPRTVGRVLAVAVVLGFVASAPNAFGDRTSAGRVAAALRAQARPGDVVAYCPDQLGPSVSRLLPAGLGLAQVTFPRAAAPELVDWVGYGDVDRKASVAPFARTLLSRAGPANAVWVVWAPGYRTFGTTCQALLTELRGTRPGERRVLRIPTTTFERPGLVGYPPG